METIEQVDQYVQTNESFLLQRRCQKNTFGGQFRDNGLGYGDMGALRGLDEDSTGPNQKRLCTDILHKIASNEFRDRLEMKVLQFRKPREIGRNISSTNSDKAYRTYKMNVEPKSLGLVQYKGKGPDVLAKGGEGINVEDGNIKEPKADGNGNYLSENKNYQPLNYQGESKQTPSDFDIIFGDASMSMDSNTRKWRSHRLNWLYDLEQRRLLRNQNRENSVAVNVDEDQEGRPPKALEDESTQDILSTCWGCKTLLYMCGRSFGN